MQVDLYLPAGRQLVFWRVRIWRSLRMNRGLHCPSIDAGDWIPHNNSGINCHSFIFLFIFSLFLSFSLFFSPFPPSVLHALNRNEQQSTIGRLQGGGIPLDGWMDWFTDEGGVAPLSVVVSGSNFLFRVCRLIWLFLIDFGWAQCWLVILQISENLWRNLPSIPEPLPRGAINTSPAPRWRWRGLRASSGGWRSTDPWGATTKRVKSHSINISIELILTRLDR